MILVVRSEPERPPSQISAASVRPRRLHGGRLSEDQVSKLSRDIQITHRHMEVTSELCRLSLLLLTGATCRSSASCCRSWCRGRSTPRTWRCWWAWRRPARRCRTGCWSWWARWAGIGGPRSRDQIVSSHWSGHRAPGHHRGPARDQRQDEQRDGEVPALPGQVCQQDSQERPGGEGYYQL